MIQPRPRRRAAHAAPRSRPSWLPTSPTVRPGYPRLLPAPVTALLLGVSVGAFSLLGATGPQATPPVAASVSLTANAVAPPVALATGRDALREERGDERASRSRAVRTPVRRPVARKPAPPVLPGCDGRTPSVAGLSNGQLPGRVLCVVPGGSGQRLRADAAVAFVRLAGAYRAAFGDPICLTDGYRTLGQQRQLRRIKPGLSARPGTSEHGWGLAIDLACGVQSFRSEKHAWMVAHAGRYGWYLPPWAQRGGSRPEPWHWEYAGA